MQKYNICNNLSLFFIYLCLNNYQSIQAMKLKIIRFLTGKAVVLIFCLGFISANSQNTENFWSKVRFGGSIGMAFGNNYTDVMVAPGALYEVNQYYGVGLAAQVSYIQQRDFYESWLYGGSLINVFNPIPQIQLSAELEQLRVNLDYDNRYTELYGPRDRDFWNTALFLGAGYRTPNVTVGIRYNVLFDDNDMVYSEAWMPFVRVYF